MTQYREFLDSAWKLHLQPRQPDAPTVISLFAGCGGSSLGYSMAGFRELLAVEWDDNAVATFKLNFPGVPVFHGDVVKLTVDESLRIAGLQAGELDVLDGSPPCQGFSTAGRRDFDDQRNSLFREYVRLLRGLKPKVFIMENVSGMVKGKMKLIFAEILRELKASGYRVSARLMNTMYFEVPQSRERMIFVGVREDLNGVQPSHPRAMRAPICALCAIGDLKDTRNPYKPRKFNQASRHLTHHRPSPTLTKSEVPGSDLPFNGPIRIADRSAAVIGSFPRHFQFVGKWTDAINRIANSVPPLFMKAIAENLRTDVLGTEQSQAA